MEEITLRLGKIIKRLLIPNTYVFHRNHLAGRHDFFDRRETRYYLLARSWFIFYAMSNVLQSRHDIVTDFYKNKISLNPNRFLYKRVQDPLHYYRGSSGFGIFPALLLTLPTSGDRFCKWRSIWDLLFCPRSLFALLIFSSFCSFEVKYNNNT